jgi:hypothetical protein
MDHLHRRPVFAGVAEEHRARSRQFDAPVPDSLVAGRWVAACNRSLILLHFSLLKWNNVFPYSTSVEYGRARKRTTACKSLILRKMRRAAWKSMSNLRSRSQRRF